MLKCLHGVTVCYEGLMRLKYTAEELNMLSLVEGNYDA